MRDSFHSSASYYNSDTSWYTGKKLAGSHSLARASGINSARAYVINHASELSIDDKKQQEDSPVGLEYHETLSKPISTDLVSRLSEQDQAQAHRHEDLHQHGPPASLLTRSTPPTSADRLCSPGRYLGAAQVTAQSSIITEYSTNCFDLAKAV
ncbi:MAG: hypothetical protein CYPHOPRED_002371 [Cyphobasidiales sp. Tagirdzhanova-0007]|nr:MAG: hypothetical protein CYPHOPRED_002371 [Cyphobasidiales sp. Tagirdzhanova-0007]